MEPKSPISAADQLRSLGVKGILWQIANDGQLLDVRCETPQCYCKEGRRHSTTSQRAPSGHLPPTTIQS